jgi:hypothetical protein
MLSAGNYNAWIKMLSQHFKITEVANHVKSVSFAKDDYINIEKQTPHEMATSTSTSTTPPPLSYLDRELARQKIARDAAINAAYPGAESMTDPSSRMKVAEKKLAIITFIEKDLAKIAAKLSESICEEVKTMLVNKSNGLWASLDGEGEDALTTSPNGATMMWLIRSLYKGGTYGASLTEDALGERLMRAGHASPSDTLEAIDCIREYSVILAEVKANKISTDTILSSILKRAILRFEIPELQYLQARQDLKAPLSMML